MTPLKTTFYGINMRSIIINYHSFICESCAFVSTEKEDPIQTQTGFIVEGIGKGKRLLIHPIL